MSSRDFRKILSQQKGGFELTLTAVVINDKKVKGRKYCISKQQEIGVSSTFIWKT